MKDWYTVPRAWGGRTFPLHRRLFLEWLWRRHGEAGLWWYSNRMSRRALASARKIGQAFNRMTVEMCWTASVFDEFTEAMRGAGLRRKK
jgi:hypothetical protein